LSNSYPQSNPQREKNYKNFFPFNGGRAAVGIVWVIYPLIAQFGWNIVSPFPLGISPLSYNVIRDLLSNLDFLIHAINFMTKTQPTLIYF
jgi:hypothetical protein